MKTEGISRTYGENYCLFEKAVRIAIAVGTDVDYEPLQKFIGNPEIKPLQANNPENLVRQIKWVSTAVIGAVSAPMSRSIDSYSQQKITSIEQRIDRLEINQSSPIQSKPNLPPLDRPSAPK